MHRSLSLRSTLLLVGSLLPAIANANTYTVRPDATGDFATIQAAINAAAIGDVILLSAGTFRGPGNRDLSFGGKAITVRSASGDPWQCTIDCQSNQISRHRGFVFATGEGPGTVVEGIRITNGQPPTDSHVDWGGAMVMEYASPTIRNCVLDSNGGHWGGGIACLESDAVIEDVFMRDNFGIGAGMYITTNSDLHLTRVTAYACSGIAFAVVASNPVFENCTASYCAGGGWSFQAGSTAVIRRSIAAFNLHEAIVCSNSTVVFECSDLFGNTEGDWVGCAAGQESINGNFSADPLFCPGHTLDAEIDEASPCAAGNSPCGTRVGAWAPGCSAVATGACCEIGTGQCFITYQNLCEQAGEYLGDGVSCDPNPCNTTGVGAGPMRAGAQLELNVTSPAQSSLRYTLQLAHAAFVDLTLVDAGGRSVAQQQAGFLEAGPHSLAWSPQSLPSGSYWLIAKTPTARAIQRVSILH